jgi:hypothetical protein
MVFSKADQRGLWRAGQRGFRKANLMGSWWSDLKAYVMPDQRVFWKAGQVGSWKAALRVS